MMEQFGKENEQKKAAEQKAADAKKDPKATKPEEKKDANKPTASNTAATLDQVVEALLLLNSNMSKLLTQSESLSNKQIRATKATSNSVQP
jgi:hypothetical protein